MKKHRLTRILLTSLILLSMLLVCACNSHSGSLGEIDNIAPTPDAQLPPNEKDSSFGSKSILDLPDAEGTQKLIYTSSVYAETRDFDAAASSLNQRISSFGGYVESQSSHGSTYQSKRAKSLTVSIRIPSAKFGEFVDCLDEIMNVTSVSSNVENITAAYYDTEARLDTLKAERESLRKMMESLDNAKQYDFWLTLQRRLSEIEQEIASLESQLRNYDNRVSYSTIKLTLSEVAEYTQPAAPTFGERISRAFKSSWKSFADFWQDVAVKFVSMLPVIIMLAAIVGAVLAIITISNKKKKKKTDK